MSRRSMQWSSAHKREALTKSRDADEVRRSPSMSVEHDLPPRSLNVRDSRGRRISLPRVSILERKP